MLLQITENDGLIGDCVYSCPGAVENQDPREGLLDHCRHTQFFIFGG